MSHTPPVISIVMACYNRRGLTIQTLKSIAKSSAIDRVEVIIVDDGSIKSESVKDLEEKYEFLKVIECHDKWSCNPCIPFNIGFGACQGKIIVIQNPECYHAGDLLSVVESQFQTGQYWVAACYSLNQVQTELLRDQPHAVRLLPYPVVTEGASGWYHHSVYRPVGYHFCSVIGMDTLKAMGGFHDIFFKGPAYDDDEFLHRVRRRQDTHVIFRDDLVVYHQWHYGPSRGSNPIVYSKPEPWSRNEFLYHHVTKPRRGATGWLYPKIPKVAHFACIGPPTKLNVYSLITFHELNPTWDIHLYTEQPLVDMQDAMYDELLALPYVRLFNFPSHIQHRHLDVVQKSDLLRWHILSTVGGVWLDMNIYFMKPMDHFVIEGHMMRGHAYDMDTLVACHGKDSYIDVLMACPMNPFYTEVYKLAWVEPYARGGGGGGGGAVFRLLELIPSTFGQLSVGNLPMTYFYEYGRQDADMKELYEQKLNYQDRLQNSIGVHWNNGGLCCKLYARDWVPREIEGEPETPFEYAMKIQSILKKYVSVKI